MGGNAALIASIDSSLQTLAEVSVALAGFASLLVVLRRGSAPALSQEQGADLFVVVGGNLLVLAFSLFPAPLHRVGASESASLRICSALLAVALSLGYAAVVRLRASLLDSGSQPFFPRVSRVSVHAPLVLVAVLLAISVGLTGDSTAGTYVLVLIFLLLLSTLPLLFVVVGLALASDE